MRKASGSTLIAFVFACFFIAQAPCSAALIAQVGKAAPAFSFTSLDGDRRTSASFAGHPLFLNFFATWCPPCKLELPNIVKQYPAYHGSVVFLGVDQEESPELVKPFVKQYRIPYEIGIDEGAVGDAFGVAALPESVFIDRHGVVRAIWRGYMPAAEFVRDMSLIL